MDPVSSVDGVVEVDCEEYGHVDVDPRLLLTQDGRELDIDESIKNKDVYRVSFSKGRLRFTASSYVGVIPLNDRVILRVRPRVPIANLTQMVVETGHPLMTLKALRAYRGHGTASDWILDRYAEAMIDHVEQILNNGLYRRYMRREELGGFPRGRIDFHKTAARFAARGIPNRAVYSWHDRSADIPPNQCLKAALTAVHAHLTRDTRRGRMVKGYGAMVATLSHQMHALAHISNVPVHELVKDPEVTGARPFPEPRFYYRPAIDLALLILSGKGVALDLEGDDAKASSLLIEMNDLFEKYTRLLLQREATRRNWEVAILDQEGAVPLYKAPRNPPEPFGEPMKAIGPGTPAEATPDMVFRMAEGHPVLVVEVKNTAKGGILPEREEVNQAVTYAVRYGLDKALLGRPRTEGRAGLAFAGQVGRVAVYDYKIDLSTDDVDGVTKEFAEAVASLMPPEATGRAVNRQ